MSDKLKTDVLVYIHCFDPAIDLSYDRHSHVRTRLSSDPKFNKVEKYLMTS